VSLRRRTKTTSEERYRRRTGELTPCHGCQRRPSYQSGRWKHLGSRHHALCVTAFKNQWIKKKEEDRHRKRLSLCNRLREGRRGGGTLGKNKSPSYEEGTILQIICWHVDRPVLSSLLRGESSIYSFFRCTELALFSNLRPKNLSTSSSKITGREKSSTNFHSSQLRATMLNILARTGM